MSEATPGTWEWVFQQMHKQRNPTGWREDMYGRRVIALEVMKEDGTPLMCIPDYLCRADSLLGSLYAYEWAMMFADGLTGKHQYRYIAIQLHPPVR